MARELFKPSVLLGPLPAVLVTTVNTDGEANVFTVAWVGVACSHPPMVSIAVRKERHSYENLVKTGEFVINLTTSDMAKITDFCGCRSARKINKIAHLGLELEPGAAVAVPSLVRSPAALECRVCSITELGSHDLFLAEVVCNKVDSSLIDEKGKFDFAGAGMLAYIHGEYFGLRRHPVGTFGFSVAKKSTRRARHERRLQMSRSHRQKKYKHKKR